MNYAEAMQWKFPGKKFAFRDCSNPGSFTPIGTWDDPMPTAEDIEAAKAEYDAAQEARLYYDTGLGFRLKTDDPTQGELAKLVTLLDTAGSLGQAPASVSFWADGELRTLPLLEFKTMILGYGSRCYQLKLEP